MTAIQTTSDAKAPLPGTIIYDDKIVRMFLSATVLWAVGSFLIGIVAAIELAFPGVDMGIEQLKFGRLRPLHTNLAVYAFAGNTLFAGIYYSTQRLCHTRMASGLLSRLHFWGWQLVIIALVVTLPAGLTQGRAYVEAPWPIDIAILIVWLGLFGGNYFLTLARRLERRLYVSLWFYTATIVAVSLLHILNNLALPVLGGSLFESYPVYAGVFDAVMQAWYAQNLFGFFLTVPFLGLMYYFLPKAADRPVYSYKLCVAHFWTLIFIYIWTGPRNLPYTPLAEWASTLGMVTSLLLWAPGLGGLANGLLTLRGAWQKVAADPALKFIVAALFCYGILTTEDTLLSVKSVNALAQYTDWTIAHVHVGTMGFNGLMAFGVMYYLLPRLYQTPLFSTKLAHAHLWLCGVGLALYVIPIYVAGISQSRMWLAMTESGQLLYPRFIDTMGVLFPLYLLRIGGGMCYLVGTLMGLGNYILTWRARPAVYDEPVLRTAASIAEDDAPPAVSRVHAVTDLGHRLDVFTQLGWHRRLEASPLRFTLLVAVTLGTASMAAILPVYLTQQRVPADTQPQTYTPLELIGRDIYIAQGCYNCHTQLVRPILAETKRYGDYSRAADSASDHPALWGSRRIGPDLSHIGWTNPDPAWHYRHLMDPRSVVPGSIMPGYPFLAERDTDYASIARRVEALRRLGVAYTPGDVQHAEEHARAQALSIAAQIADGGEAPAAGVQDKQIIALIAYLKRLGAETPTISDTTETAPD